MKTRNYRQNCSVARAADLLGERWTFLIIRDLLVAPRRFSELEKRMKGIGANLLARRLKDMAAAGLIDNDCTREPYRLTEMGRALEPMVLQMIRWSLRWVRTPAEPDGLHFADWDLLALKALFAPTADFGPPILARFAYSDWKAWVRIDGGDYSFSIGEPDAPNDIDFPCLIPALQQSTAILDQLPVSQLSAARRFLAAFPLH
ncbi:MAG: helix-turn-helix domain-containing protein [Sphingorhabdus sp.]